jgi:hypothetical protein
MVIQSAVKLAPGAVWVCTGCHVWWGSQVGKRPTTKLLLQISKSGLMPYEWDDYRGWRYNQDKTSQCPECGKHIPKPTMVVQ